MRYCLSEGARVSSLDSGPIHGGSELISRETDPTREVKGCYTPAPQLLIKWSWQCLTSDITRTSTPGHAVVCFFFFFWVQFSQHHQKTALLGLFPLSVTGIKYFSEVTRRHLVPHMEIMWKIKGLEMRRKCFYLLEVSSASFCASASSSRLWTFN